MSATYCKHNLKWAFPWNGKISLKERKKKKKNGKKLQNLYRIAEHLC